MIPHIVRPLDPWIGPSTPDDARLPSPFKTTWTETLALLDRELRQLGAPRHKPWVLQVDVPIHAVRQDGQLRADAKAPRTPAVRIAFESRHGPLTFSCDRFRTWQANIRAIALGLEALRKVDRYGISEQAEQYRGFTAIAARPAEMTRLQAAEFIRHWTGIDDWPITAQMILADPGHREQAYRLAAKRAHPDITKDDGDTMARLNQARDLLAADRA